MNIIETAKKYPSTHFNGHGRKQSKSRIKTKKKLINMDKNTVFSNKIFNEDCIVTMERMINEGFKVDSILTSPPYNMTSRKGGHSDTGRYDVYKDWKTEEEYIDWMVTIFNNFDKILNTNRAVLFNFSYSIENPSLPYKLVVELEKRTPFKVIDTMI